MTIISWFTLTLLFSALIWVSYVLNRVFRVGVLRSMQTPSSDWPALSPWALRARAAHMNAVENLAIFAPLTLAVIIEIKDPQILASASVAVMVYFFSRIAHFTIYTLSIPYLRTLAFLFGFGAQLFLASLLFNI